MGCPDVLITDMTWGGTPIPTPQGFQYALTQESLKTRAIAKTGPSCNQLLRQNMEVVVTFLEPGFFTPNQAAADLVIKTRAGGVVTTRTFADVIPRDFGEQFDNNSPPGARFQKFEHEGDMDTVPITESQA